MKVDYIDRMGSDLRVANAARVSFNKEHNEFLSTDEKLIYYLAKHKHKSPFNHTFITMRVKAPIFVARQLVKHEYMPWNEVSRRYVDDEPEFFKPEGWRAKAENVKQGSSKEFVESVLRQRMYGDQTVDEAVQRLEDHAVDLYVEMLEHGVAPEMARMILPQNMYTEWYWSGTLYSWAKMYALRSDSHAQVESQEVARQVDEIIQPLFPISWEALKGNIL